MFNPALFSPDMVSPETAAFNARLAQTLVATPRPDAQPAEVTRRQRAAGQGALGALGPIVRLNQAKNRAIPGPAGDIPLRLFVPERVDGVYLFLHGGGWVLGSADLQDVALWKIATRCHVAVISVDYRLAPEHPYPAGPDDCETAALWLAQRAPAEFGTDRLIVGGGSAGGHLAAATLLRLRDRHGYTGFRGADLVYGVFDLSMTPSQRSIGQDSLVIDARLMSWFYNQFVPGMDRHDPDISPLYADLRNLPPALFTVGTLDPLLDDSILMHARWRAAENAAELSVSPGGVHGFTGFPIALARAANARRRAFIRAALQGD